MPDQVDPFHRVDWIDTALSSSDAFAEGLRQLGVGDAAIAEDLRDYRDGVTMPQEKVRRELSEHAARSGPRRSLAR